MVYCALEDSGIDGILLPWSVVKSERKPREVARGPRKTGKKTK